jgi:hypothetical protein
MAGQRCRVPAAHHGLDPEPVAVGQNDVRRGAADGARGPENREGLCH